MTLLSKAPLTILTAIVPEHRKLLQMFKRKAVEKLHLLTGRGIRYAGHPGVTRSLVEGLRKIGADFNYNPACLEHVGETTVVLADRGALEQAIIWKREGKISRLLAGPNLVVLPLDAPELITALEIDIYLVNSEWTYRAYLDDAPVLKENCHIWAAGVDVEFWKPSHHIVSDGRILIYQKNAPEEMLTGCRHVIEHAGFKTVLLKYGDYSANYYLEKLRECEAAVFLSPLESQGIALAEAWAVNVPTIVWNPGWFIYNKKTVSCSSAPYLTKESGLLFNGSEEFIKVFEEWQKTKNCFNPREWVLKNMTDEISAMKLLKLTRFTT